MSSPEGFPSFDTGFTPPEPGDLAALIPQYRIDHLIAAGGMGAVYRGEHRELERQVAIKVLPPEFARDSEAIARFRTEAKAMARLTHPNIPAVFDFDVVRGICYFVMEYVDGTNVHAMVHRKQLTPELSLSILIQVCEAMEFAHGRQVVHGDIKPANILVNSEGRAKLTDFGLARLMERDDSENEPEAMGTLEYSAPEIFEPGGRRDYRADIFSLGPVLYEMLTGAPPHGEFFLPAADIGLDPRVDSVIARCMEIDPAARWQSAGEIKQVLQSILTHPQKPGAGGARPHVRIIRQPPRRRPPGRRSGPAPSRPLATSHYIRPPGTGRRRPSRRGSPVLLIAGILVAILLAVLTVMLIRQRRPPAPAPDPPKSAPAPRQP